MPFSACSGISACAPGAGPSGVSRSSAPYQAIRSGSQRPSTRIFCSGFGSNGSGEGSPASAASSAASRPRFHSRRWSCHTPSPISTASIAAVIAAGTSSRRSPLNSCHPFPVRRPGAGRSAPPARPGADASLAAPAGSSPPAAAPQAPIAAATRGTRPGRPVSRQESSRAGHSGAITPAPNM